MLASAWVVNVKGGDPIFAGFEIAVVRENYTLGRESCGWFDKDRKRLISAAGIHLLELARNVATELNAAEARS